MPARRPETYASGIHHPLHQCRMIAKNHYLPIWSSLSTELCPVLSGRYVMNAERDAIAPFVFNTRVIRCFLFASIRVDRAARGGVHGGPSSTVSHRLGSIAGPAGVELRASTKTVSGDMVVMPRLFSHNVPFQQRFASPHLS